MADRAGTRPDPKVAARRPPGAGAKCCRGDTTYRVDRPPRRDRSRSPPRWRSTLVFAATAALCAYRAGGAGRHAARSRAGRPRDRRLRRHRLAAAILAVAATIWAVRGAHFADNLAFAVLWPIATVLMVIAAGAAAVPSTTCASVSCWSRQASPRPP